MGDRASINASYGGRQSGADGEAIMASFGGGQISGGSTPAPTFTANPSITGTPTSGQALSALTFTDGTVSNGSVSARSYLLAGVSKALSYVLQAGDVGASLVFHNDATGPGGTASADSAAKTVVAAVTPPVAPTVYVNEVDSRTWDPTSYAYNYKTANPSLTITVTAQSGSVIGTPSDTPTNTGLTLWGRRNYIKSLNPQVLTMWVGANELGDYPGATHEAAAQAYYTAWRAFAVWAKANIPTLIYTVFVEEIGLSPTGSFASRATAHNARRAFLNSYLRRDVGDGVVDAVVGFGSHPFIGTDAGASDRLVLGDGVHEARDGINFSTEVYTAVMDPMRDGSNATLPTAFTLPQRNNAVAGTFATTRFMVKGLRYGTSILVSATNGAEVRVGSGAWTSGSVLASNGDVVSIRIMPNASAGGSIATAVSAGARVVSWTVLTAPASKVAVATSSAVFITTGGDAGSTGSVNVTFPAGRPGIGLRLKYNNALTAKINGITCTKVAGDPDTNTNRSFNHTMFLAPEGTNLAAGSYLVEFTTTYQSYAAIFPFAATDCTATNAAIAAASSFFRSDFNLPGFEFGNVDQSPANGGLKLILQSYRDGNNWDDDTYYGKNTQLAAYQVVSANSPEENGWDGWSRFLTNVEPGKPFRRRMIDNSGGTGQYDGFISVVLNP